MVTSNLINHYFLYYAHAAQTAPAFSLEGDAAAYNVPSQ